MRWVVRIVALAVVAFTFATPLMACVMDAASLTVSEAQCCRQMKGDCHDSLGPASHKCCRTLPRSTEASATAKSAPPSLAIVAVVPAVPAPVARAAEMFAGASDDSPPGSPPGTDSILRI